MYIVTSNEKNEYINLAKIYVNIAKKDFRNENNVFFGKTMQKRL